MNAIELLEREEKMFREKFYALSERVNKGEKKLKEHRDYYMHAEQVTCRLIELLIKEVGA